MEEYELHIDKSFRSASINALGLENPKAFVSLLVISMILINVLNCIVCLYSSAMAKLLRIIKYNVKTRLCTKVHNMM